MPELEITISPTGKVTGKTRGIKGETCIDYAELLAEILGRKEKLDKTPEFYEREQVLLSQSQAKQTRNG